MIFALPPGYLFEEMPDPLTIGLRMKMRLNIMKIVMLMFA